MFDILDEIPDEALLSPKGRLYVMAVLKDLPNLYESKTAEQLTENDKKRLHYMTSDLNRALDAMKEEFPDLLKILADKGYPYAQELYIKELDLKKYVSEKCKYMQMLSNNPYTVNGTRGYMRAELEKMGVQSPPSPTISKPAKRGAVFSAVKYEETKPQTNLQILQRQFKNNGEKLIDLSHYPNKTVHLSSDVKDTIMNIHSDFNRYLKSLKPETIESLAHKGYPYAQFLTAEQVVKERHFNTAKEWIMKCLKNPLTLPDLQDLALDSLNAVNKGIFIGRSGSSHQKER